MGSDKRQVLSFDDKRSQINLGKKRGFSAGARESPASVSSKVRHACHILVIENHALHVRKACLMYLGGMPFMLGRDALHI